MNPAKIIKRFYILILVVIIAVENCALIGNSQEPSVQPSPSTQPASGIVRPAAGRRLAPYVMKKVDPYLETGKVFSRHDVVELIKTNPDFDWAKDVTFRRDIWYLEFEFKPMRMIPVDIPQANGQFMRKNVWYLIYKVKNPGKALHPAKDLDNSFKLERTDKPINFAPFFTLESSADDGVKKVYPDRLVPVAMNRIRMREDPGRQFLNTVEMCQTIPVGGELWGVATWIDIDPKIDSFNICIRGLTNAYRWSDDIAKVNTDKIAEERKLECKILQINFWRPGDEFYENEKEIVFGRPGELDYLWIYR